MSDTEEYPVSIVRLPGSGLEGGGRRRSASQHRNSGSSESLNSAPDQPGGHRGRGRGRGRGGRPRGGRGGHYQGNAQGQENAPSPRGGYRGRSDGQHRGGRGGNYQGNAQGQENASSPRGAHRGRSDGQHRGSRGSRGGGLGGRGHDQHGMRRWQSSEGVSGGAQAAGGPPGRERKKEFVPMPMGYRKLSELSSKQDFDEIALELTSSKGGFELLLNSDTIRPDVMNLLLEVLERACKSTKRESLLKVLNLLCSKMFFGKHVNKCLTDSLLPTQKTSMYDNVIKLLNLCDIILQRLPSSAEKCVASLFLMQNVLTHHQLTTTHPELEQRRVDLVTACQEAALVEKEAESKKRSKRRGITADDDTPPDDFREIDMFPGIEDIQQGRHDVFLRKNKDEGAYADLNTYLDVQFRLLREDYIQPLRKGIQDYQNCLKRGETPKKNTDLRLYYDVRIVGSVCNEDVETRLKFDTTNTAKVRWQSSKRLIFGSLVGLSQDDFETIIFATVTNRNPKDLENGVIQVKFESNFDLILNSNATDSFLMAETTAYFEAYKHVLYRLQQIDENMPFQKYIVQCKPHVRPPQYLMNIGKTHYDLSTLGNSGSFCPELQSVAVLTTDRWPSLSNFELDESQLNAVKTALSKELAVIQGPPGTGKTYVGLKIAKVLFENRDAWALEEDGNAILVVCYTNHALDQFLEGIAKFLPEGIVRVGGRSSSEELAKFNIKEIRNEVRKNRMVRRSIKDNSMDCKKYMSTLRRDIEEVSSRIEASSNGILHEKVLQQFMVPALFESLTRGLKQGETKSVMQCWLGFEDMTAVTEDGQARQVLTDHWKTLVLKRVRSGSPPKREKPIDEDKVVSLRLAKRVKLYQGWVIQFRSHIRKKISETETGNDYYEDEEDYDHVKVENPQLAGLKFQLQSSYNDILEDVYLRPFMTSSGQNVFRAITTSKYAKYQEGLAIKTWLGASPHLIDDSLPQAIQELEAELDEEFLPGDDDELATMDEEADIIASQRFVDDKDDIFQTKSGTSAFLLAKAMETVAISMNSLDSGKGGKQGESQEWEIQSQQKKKLKKKLESILRSKDYMDPDDVGRVRDVWRLPIPERIGLYKYWVLRYQNYLKDSIRGKEQEYRDTANRLKEVLMEEDKDILMKSKVIGMTTTGAAKHATLLQAVSPRIIIVEEAAEVLESHIITTLNPKCQQLILIGDHQQLRPNPTVYDLAKTYHLDISLFERLIKNEMHHVTLSLQHRMRPDVSILMKHIYPDLRDHDSVKSYPNVLGVEKNVFFVHHEYHEERQEETKSKTNVHEASFIVALCRYILLQGYKPSEVTILAAYTGQILLIKRQMSKMANFYKGVRLTSVDNYQGEENKIILLSLVRSNEEGSVGFLGIDNRVCVALSRAKEGLFAIGNFKLLEQKSALWKNIVETLKEKKFLGLNLKLICQNHPSMVIEASKSTDFDRAPEGGCTKPCDIRLPCGHVCERICHNVDRAHKGFKCKKPCQKPLPDCEHPCPKKCYEPCEKCKVQVQKVIPMCGHTDSIPCFFVPHRWICQNNCEVNLPCGHQCKGNCGKCRTSGHKTLCTETVERLFPCGHVQQVACHTADLSITCSRPCVKTLDCTHKCKGSCGECFHGKIHKACQKKCSKKLPCSHKCESPCGTDCLPCTATCTLQCPNKHSKCNLPCGKVCQPCKERCTLGCIHRQCNHLCSSMCSDEICNEPCMKTVLPCYHSCIGLCGEPCFCKECNKDELQKISRTPTTGQDEDNDQTPQFIKVEPCGHFYLKDFLDTWVKAAVNMKVLPACKTCKGPIKESPRYANATRETFNAIQDMKKAVLATVDYQRSQSMLLKQSIASSSLPMRYIRELTKFLEESSSNPNTVKAVDFQFQMLKDLYNLHTAVQSSPLNGTDLAKELDAVQEHLLQKKNSMSIQMVREYKDEMRDFVTRIKEELEPRILES